jgi:exonuclease SbcC
MIPVNLKMHNFMPYKGDTPPLSFMSIHTACISGDNGAGKSSIIDAITWALWGKARSKSDDELVYQGENETMVEFDFNSGGQIYRVIRKHSRPKNKKGSGQSSLDLFICNEGVFLPLSAERATLTQVKLETILHMDYDTFINSAYLRQGHADEFTHQTPGKRKEVLSNILGLSIYDDFEDIAKQRSREAEQAKTSISMSISELENEIASKPACETDLVKFESILVEIDKSAEITASEVKQLQAKEQALGSIKDQFVHLGSVIAHHREDISRENESLNKSKARLFEYKKLLDNQAIIESGFNGLKIARETYDKMNQRARKFSKLNEKYSQLEKTRDRVQNDLNTQHKLVENAINQFETKCKQLPQLKQEQRTIATAQHELTMLDHQIEVKRALTGNQKTALSTMLEAIQSLKKEVEDIDEKLKLLVETQKGPRCPLCETELGTRELDVVKAKYIGERARKLETIKGNERDSASLVIEIKTAEAETTAFENKQKNEYRILTAREARNAQGIKEAIDASAKLAEEKQKLAEIEETLITQNYAPAEKAALTELMAEIASLSYEEKEHDSLLAQVEKLGHWEEQKRRLDEALSLSVQEKNNGARCEQIISEVNARLATDTALEKELSLKMAELPDISRRLGLSGIESKRLAEEQKHYRETIAVLKERIHQITEFEKRSLEKRRTLAEACEKENLYRQLTVIFGKKGLQAMLIETALPEIEAEANRLLSRMTDGRMNLTFETQQATRKGDISETLDIKIADELGTRSYEMFSGGEGFRIDFSIRIALARLLARRAGAPLPTLIIDEGFGTQDADGIEKLKEAINSVQDDFQKILVITHIEELKDAFPTRIEVVKKANGSTIEVS